MAKTLEYMWKGYRLEVRYTDEDYAQVTMKDVGARLPILWSMGMTKKEARGAIELFKAIGYFGKPMKVTA